MKKLLRSWLPAATAVLLILGAFTLTSCIPHAMEWVTGSGDEDATDSGEGDVLRVLVDDQLARTLVPAIDMTAASYVITGRGPDSESFVRTTTAGSVDIEKLKAGQWSVTVEATNAAGKIIGSGTVQIALKSNAAATANVQVKPLSGYGTVTVTVNWPAADVASPSVTAQLIPAAGAAKNLTFTLGTGTATSTTANIPTGYHTLSLQVLDGGTLVAGAIEIVRIVKNETTAGVFTFSQVNSIPVDMQVNITPTLADPLVVSLSGATATVVEGTGFTAQASVAGFTGNLVYAWYLNSQFGATGTSFSVPTDLDQGTYRMDVTAMAADGSRAGSKSTTFAVTAAPAGTQVTLAWDASADPTVTGYKLHYGTVNGVYGTTINVGNATSYTVTGLQVGVTYYFAATSYNAAGVESAYSNGVAFNS